MKNIVLLTSAVYTNYGIYNPQDRIKQTLDTAISARKYIPGAVIILVDNSKIDVQNDTVQSLKNSSTWLTTISTTVMMKISNTSITMLLTMTLARTPWKL